MNNQTQKQTPYTEGWHARLRGETTLENPYNNGEYSYQMWLEGWLDKDEQEDLSLTMSNFSNLGG